MLALYDPPNILISSFQKLSMIGKGYCYDYFNFVMRNLSLKQLTNLTQTTELISGSPRTPIGQIFHPMIPCFTETSLTTYAANQCKSNILNMTF